MMNKEEKLKKYNEWVFKQSAYNMALALINYDKLTVAPISGSDFREKRSAFLAGEAFSISTDKEIFKIIKELKDDESLDPATSKALKMYYKKINNLMCIPKEDYIAYYQLVSQSYNAWLEAKNKNDYKIFEPYLKEIIESQKKIYGYRDSKESIYNQMLDDYETGMKEEDYDKFFYSIKNRLIPFINKIIKAKNINDAFLYRSYDIDSQKLFMHELINYLNFDRSWGYLSESEHPYTTWMCENDCRTTTKYIKYNISAAILSTIHEVGHATYEHNISDEYDGMILSEGVSCGMHESQSRLFENYLGRSLAFWQNNFSKLKAYFPNELMDVEVEDFYRAINKSEISLIRTEADELTYPLHILIRYEIEKGLFNGSISTENLNETWNQKYEEYLGIKVENDREGILQDIHWSDGSFGYFPTYALGSAFAAQFMNKMRKDIDVDSLLRDGEFSIIVNWLKDNIHQYGALYDARDLIEKVSGHEFDVNEYIDYLIEKYTELYNLS